MPKPSRQSSFTPGFWRIQASAWSCLIRIKRPASCAEFTLAGQGFSAMDGGTDHHFTFSPGLSLEVSCADQEEIDRLWEVLSSVAEAEQCGWVADRFGVSWQIVPENMGELMQHPGAFSRMLEMKKIIMAEL
ncbi:VOC family protein [Arthrobacter alpinus]|nr:VOC family protein [Arthrobacter alpinus]